MNTYQRIFGAGPRGAFISIALFATVYGFFEHLKLGPISGLQPIHISLFALSVVLTIGIVVWSLKSLPPKFRGEYLVQAGAFAYFRHPLYGAFLSFFNFGLALFLNDYVYLVWALVQHPIWHLNIRYEEGLMLQKFGDEYRDYSRKVSRFFPFKYFIPPCRRS